MNSTKQLAHTAGFFYFLVAVFGIVSIMIVPSQIIDWSSSSTTWMKLSNPEKIYFFNLLNGKQLLFISIVSGVICLFCIYFLSYLVI